MTKAIRKPRSDSISEMTRIMQGAAIEVAPPAHVPLKANHWPFWHSVVAEFARADWTEHQLELAAMLARCMAQVEEQQRLLEDEGFLVDKGEQGVKVENARARSVQTLMGQILSLRRSLALHARAKSGTNADAIKQREKNRATEKAGAGEDDLLA